MNEQLAKILKSAISSECPILCPENDEGCEECAHARILALFKAQVQGLENPYGTNEWHDTYGKAAATFEKAKAAMLALIDSDVEYVRVPDVVMLADKLRSEILIKPMDADVLAQAIIAFLKGDR